MIGKRFRLVTRSNFDGLVCTALFKEIDLINEIQFTHPKAVQDGVISLNSNDITASLPYDKRAYLAFDHHYSETVRLKKIPNNYIIIPDAPSTARVIYNHYGGKEAFSNFNTDLIAAVDQGNIAQFEHNDIVNANGWPLLNFLVDARTGLGRFREFRISNYQLMIELIDYCRNHTIEEILALPDIVERIELYREHEHKFIDQIKRCTTVHDKLAVLDLRNEEVIYAGNRFMIYTLFPDINISTHIFWSLQKSSTVFSIGKSIFNRSSTTNIGKLMLKYGGGGHKRVGSCQVNNHQVEQILEELISKINTDG